MGRIQSRRAQTEARQRTTSKGQAAE
jgi:hypothetical protein